MEITEKNLNRFFEVYERMKSLQGFDKLSKDEQNFMLTFYPEMDEAKLTEYLSNIKDPKKYEEWSAKIGPENVALFQEEFRKNVANNKTAFLDTAKRLETERKTKGAVQMADMFLAGADMVDAKNQINRFKSESKRSRRPGRPPILGRDPYLAAAKEDALKANYDESTAIEAAKSGIQDAYLGDIANARIASGGQAGSFGAYAQSAATRRGRRALELAPVANEVYQQRAARRDRLAGMSAAENQAINESAGRYYPSELEQYKFEQQQLADLGSQGFANRRVARGEIASAIPGAIDQATTQKYNRYYARLGDKWGSALADVDRKLAQVNERQAFAEGAVAPPNQMAVNNATTPQEFNDYMYGINQPRWR